jgi:hypothetical protein
MMKKLKSLSIFFNPIELADFFLVEKQSIFLPTICQPKTDFFFEAQYIIKGWSLALGTKGKKFPKKVPRHPVRWRKVDGDSAYHCEGGA